MYYNRWAPPPDELYHFGVKGMRWGVRKDRRYVTKGGSGYRHYNKVDKHLGDRQLIRKGTKMYRMTTAENENGSGSTYVTFQDADRKFYRHYITNTTPSGKAYEKEYVLNKDLSIPSRDEVKQAYSEAVQAIGKEIVDKSVKEMVLGDAASNYKRLSDVYSALARCEYPEERPDGKFDIIDDYVTGKKLMTATEKEIEDAEMYGGQIATYEYIMRNVKDKTMSDYAYGMGSLTKNPKVKEHMIKTLSAKGYNAIVDEAGVGTITDTKDKSIARREGVAPLILFDRGVLTEKNSTLYDSNNRDQWNSMYKDYNKSINDISQMRARKAI